MTDRLRGLVDTTGLTRVTLGHGRTVHYRHPIDRAYTVCGLGPAPYSDPHRGIIEPALTGYGATPTLRGHMRATENPVTCARCRQRDGGARMPRAA